MPVYNSSAYLRQALDSVVGQTLRSIEVICVDDGSTDSSAGIIEEYASKDPRVKLFRQGNAGAGTARNAGTACATGKYLHYLDSDDWLEPDAYERIVGKMETTGVDVCIFQKSTYDNVTGEDSSSCRAFRTDDYVTDFDSNPSFFIHSPVVPWNKLIRREVVVENGLRYDEIPCANDRSFYFALIRCARSVMVCKDQLIHYRVNNAASLVGNYRSTHYDAHFTAFNSTMSCFEDADDAVKRAVIDVSMVDMFRFYDRARVWYKPRIYRQLHGFLNTVDFSSFEDFKGYGWWGRASFIREHPHGFPRMFLTAHMPHPSPSSSGGERKSQVRSDVVASLTSYPARIGTIHIVIESLLSQTVKAGRTILWLAADQFPGGEAALPKKLLALRSRGLEVRFCDDDLKPHKKYFYVMREFPDSVIITVDDDVVYPPDTFERLLESYGMFPNAVSAMRVHRIALRGGRIAPYSEWGYNDDAFYRSPSMQAMATGVGGILYPPRCIPDAAFDRSAIEETCLFGDDLWLKFHEVENGVPTVLAAPSRELRYVDGTQDGALWLQNKVEGMNDRQIWSIGDWFAPRVERTPEQIIAGGRLDGRARVSFLFDCFHSDCGSVESFLSAMPDWGELVCYDVPGDGELMRRLRERWWDDRLLVLPASGARTPLYTVLGCSRGGRFVIVDPPSFDYGPPFFEAVSEALQTDGGIVPDVPRISSSIGSRKAAGYAFDPMCTVLGRDGVMAGRFYHIADALSSCAVASYLGLEVPDDAADLTAVPELYNVAVLRSVELGLGRSVEGAAGEGECAYSGEPEPSRLRVCPVCGGAFRRFLPGGARLRDDATCPACRSLERHRAADVLLRLTSGSEGPAPRVLYVNPPVGTVPFLEARGALWSSPDRIGMAPGVFDAIVSCHQIQKAGDIGATLDGMRSKLSACGALYITVPLKKVDGRVNVVEGAGMDAYDLMDVMSSHGFDAELLWMREALSFESVEMFSVGNEAVFVCRPCPPAGGPQAATGCPIDAGCVE